MTKGVKQKHNEQITTIEVSASVFHSWTKSDYSCCNQHWGRYQGSGNTLAYEPRCAAAQSSCTHCAASATRSIGLHLAKQLRPGRTRRKHRGRLRDEEEISVSMQPTHQHHPSSCADSSFVAAKGSTKMASRLGRVAVDVEQAEEERLLPQRQPLLPCPRTCKAQQPTADDTSKARHGKVY